MRNGNLVLLVFALAGCSSENATQNENVASPVGSASVASGELPSSTEQAKKQGLRTLQCQMDQCDWVVEVSRESVRKTEDGDLVKVVYNSGKSDHTNKGYDNDVPIEWDPAVNTSYSFCSKSLPSQIYKSTEGWKPVVFNFSDFVFGYQMSSANAYMSVCHNIEYDAWENKEIAKRFGYRSPLEGTEELTFKNPVEIFDIVSKIGKFSFSALKDDDISPGAGCYGSNARGVGIVGVEWGGHLVMRPNGILTAFYAPGNKTMGATFFTAQDGSTVRIVEGKVIANGEESVTRSATLVYESDEKVERESIEYSCGA